MEVTAAKKGIVRLKSALDGLLPVGDSHTEDLKDYFGYSPVRGLEQEPQLKQEEEVFACAGFSVV
jgi:hypothetical protein